MAILKRLVLAMLHRLGVVHALREAWRADIEPNAEATRDVERRLKGLQQEYGSKADQTARRKAIELSIREVDGTVRRLANELKPELAEQREFIRTTSRELHKVDTRSAATAEALAELTRTVTTLSQAHQRTQRRLRLVEASLVANRELAPLAARFHALRASGEIERHVALALSNAPVFSDPTRHLRVASVLPPALYEIFLAAMPPEEAFSDRDRMKQNFKPRNDTAVLPDLTAEIWDYMDNGLVPSVMGPTLGAMFEDAILQHYTTLFGPESARELLAAGFETSGGRLMLRRPGYYIGPHLDVPRAALTTLIYLARPGDDPQYGTSLFRVNGSTLGERRTTYYPEEDGANCELVTTVPFEANSALVFLNAGAAHGAEIPKTAPPKTERYSYQFYVGPPLPALKTAVARLSPDERKAWAGV